MTESAGLAKSAGFVDDTRAYCSSRPATTSLDGPTAGSWPVWWPSTVSAWAMPDPGGRFRLQAAQGGFSPLSVAALKLGVPAAGANTPGPDDSAAAYDYELVNQVDRVACMVRHYVDLIPVPQQPRCPCERDNGMVLGQRGDLGLGEIGQDAMSLPATPVGRPRGPCSPRPGPPGRHPGCSRLWKRRSGQGLRSGRSPGQPVGRR